MLEIVRVNSISIAISECAWLNYLTKQICKFNIPSALELWYAKLAICLSIL